MPIQVETRDRFDIVDVTERVENSIMPVDRGICTVFVQHTTAALIINETESGLRSDIEQALTQLIPDDATYAHDQIDDNAAAHLRSMLLGASISIPILDGSLALGTWQSILLVECDGPRQRNVEIVVTQP